MLNSIQVSCKSDNNIQRNKATVMILVKEALTFDLFKQLANLYRYLNYLKISGGHTFVQYTTSAQWAIMVTGK